MYMTVMSKKNIGARIKQVRSIERGMSQKELSKLTDIPASTLSKLENGNQDGSSDVALIAKHLNVNALWLSHAIGPKHQNTDMVHTSSIDLSEDVHLYQFNDPRCKHGPTHGSQTAKQLPTVPFPAESFKRLDLDADDCFAYMASDAGSGTLGDSMLINTAERDPRQANGKLYALRQGASIMVRNIHVSAVGAYRLSADNPDKLTYPDEHVSASDVGNLDIAGRVRYIGGVR